MLTKFSEVRLRKKTNTLWKVFESDFSNWGKLSCYNKYGLNLTFQTFTLGIKLISLDYFYLTNTNNLF